MNRRVATVLVDALFLLVLVLVLLPHRPDPPSEPIVALYSPLLVGIRWPDGSTADVDLWVKGPGGGPVGYQRLRGSSASLLRDDVGTAGDDPVERYEIAAFVRLADGEYIVNVHLFGDALNTRPVPVQVLLWQRTPEGYKEIWQGEVTLTQLKEELTAVRLTVRDGEVLPGLFNSALHRMITK
jgi:hypothetical protein